MFDISIIQDCIRNLVGWEPSSDPCFISISTDVQTSESGQFFNTRHPLLSLNNLESIAPDFDGYNNPEFDLITAYDIGDIVKVTGTNHNTFYVSLTALNTGNDPETSPVNWELKNYFSDWLISKNRQSAATLFNNVANKKKLNKQTKTLLESIRLYEGAGRITQKVIKTGRFVGIEVVVKRGEGVSVAMDQIGIQFDTLQTGLDIYLYHSSQIDPVTTFTIDNLNHTKAVSMQFIDLGFELDYFNSTLTGPGGAFYIGYYEDDLAGQAIEKNIDYSNMCRTCQGTKSIDKWGKFVTISSIEISQGDLNGTQLWDISATKYSRTCNFGLNFQVSAKCSITDFICRNRSAFTESYIKQVEHDLLKEMVYNSRNNTLSDEIKEYASGALIGVDNSERSFMTGVAEELRIATDGVDFDLSDMNTPCLPCNNKGIKVGAA